MGRFLMREGFFGARSIGLGKRLRRDSERGIAARRFVVIDPFVSLLAMTGRFSQCSRRRFMADEVSECRRASEGGFRSAARWC